MYRVRSLSFSLSLSAPPPSFRHTLAPLVGVPVRGEWYRCTVGVDGEGGIFTALFLSIPSPSFGFGPNAMGAPISLSRAALAGDDGVGGSGGCRLAFLVRACVGAGALLDVGGDGDGEGGAAAGEEEYAEGPAPAAVRAASGTAGRAR